MIGSTLSVIAMILWDSNTRKKNDNKKKKRRKKEREIEIQRRRELGLSFDDLIDEKMTEYDLQGNVVFSLRIFVDSSESGEDTNKNLNAILDNLLSAERIGRKLFLINRKRRKIEKKVKKTAETLARQTVVLQSGVEEPIKKPSMFAAMKKRKLEQLNASQ